MVKTLDERHAEAELHPAKLPPCETETEYRKAAESGKPEALLALALALVDGSIEHQDPDEALICLDRARRTAQGDQAVLEQATEIERRASKKQHELGEALQLEIMHNQDA